MLVNCQMTETTMIGAEEGRRMRREDAEEPSPVDLRRADQFGREGRVVVAEEERGEAETVDDMDKDKARYRAGEPEDAENPRRRDQDDLERNEAGQKHHAKDDPIALETPFRQHIAVHRPEKGRYRHGGHDHQDRVQEVGFQPRRLHADLRLRPGLQPRLERPVCGRGKHVAAANFRKRFQRVHQHDPKRQQVVDREEEKHEMDDDARDPVAPDRDILRDGTAHLRPPFDSSLYT